MNNCWMLGTPKVSRFTSGGGNRPVDDKVVVRRSLAIGDVLCATTVADRLHYLGVKVGFQAHPATHCVLRLVPSISDIGPPNQFFHVNLDGVYENDPARNRKHFHKMFFDAANIQLQKKGIELGLPINCTPRIGVLRTEKQATLQVFNPYKKPWTMICPRSNSYQARTVPDAVWSAVAERLPGTVFWLGLHPAPANIVDLGVRHFDNVIRYLSVSDLLLTTDTGPMHVAAALRIPIVVAAQSSFPDWHLSDQNDFLSVYPEGNLDCLDCQQNICRKNADQPPCQRFNPDVIANAARAKLESKGKVSAAVSVYQPEANVLNKCLEILVQQVDEVVVCRDLAGKFPDKTFQHPKVKYVIKNARDIGYGRKQNYAARHTSGEYILLINDDVFLNTNAVQAMADCARDYGAGLVSNLLYYPDRTIYHAGKIRVAGERGWGHIDHRKFEHTNRQPVEMENVCGCCVLVRRTAFYDINGFDERFYLYAEDDDMALSLRSKGWKLYFTPYSTGVHMEHQSTSKTPRIVDIMHESNRVFAEKWSRYFDWNAKRVPGNFGFLAR